MDAGALDRRVQFQVRVEQDDSYGNQRGDWQAQFDCWAGLKSLRGGEGMIASRLEGRQPGILTVRKSMQTQLITPGWRVVDLHDGDTVYNIRERPRRTDDRAFLEMLVESGVAT